MKTFVDLGRPALQVIGDATIDLVQQIVTLNCYHMVLEENV